MKLARLGSIFMLVAAAGAPSLQASALTDLIDSMSEGQWAELSTDIDPSILYSSGDILAWSDSAAWDPTGKRIYAICKAAGTDPYRLIRYDEATNVWTHSDASQFVTSIPGHCYDGTTFNQNNSTMYFAYYESERILSYKPSQQTWDHLPSHQLGNRATYGLAWFPGFGGSQDSLLVSVGPNQLGWWNGTQWSSLTVDQGDFGTFGGFVEYNPVLEIVLFGGSSFTRDQDRDRVLYKIDKNQNITRLQDSPVSLMDRNTLVAVDPVSGQFIIHNHDSDEWWSLDLANGADSWEMLQFSDSPNFRSALQVPLREYGVILWVGLDKFVPHVYVYKHAPIDRPKPPLIVD